MNRRVRIATALLALAATLFAPFAMALHACRVADMERSAASAHRIAMGDGVEGGAAPLPMDELLCPRHCNPGRLSVQPPASPPTPPALPMVHALRVDALEPASNRAPAFDSPFAPAAGPAPPLIGYTVLRI